MRSTRRTTTLTAFLAVFTLVLGGFAAADTLTPSAPALTVPASGSSTIDFTLLADRLAPFTHPNCDLQGGAMQALVRFTSDDPVITLSPTSHLYTQCGESVTVTATRAGADAGTANITADVDLADPLTRLADWTHDGGNPRFGIQSATVPVTVDGGGGGGGDGVCPSANGCDAPIVTYTLAPATPDGSNGWYKTPTGVVVDWTVTGSSDGMQLSGCDDSTVTTDNAAHALTCSATNDYGTDSEIAQFKLDATAPFDIVFSGGPADGTTYELGGLIPGAPTCSASDAMSGPGACAVTGGGTGVGNHTYTATAYDLAGNSSTSALSYTVVDTTAPAVNVSLDLPSPDGDNNWYRTQVAVSMISTDLSPIVREQLRIDTGSLTDYAGAVSVSNDGNHSAYGEAEDSYGNIGHDTETFKIDGTNPSVSVTGVTAATYQTGATPGCTASDATSGLTGTVTPTIQAPSSGPLGTYTVTCNAQDMAGNTNTSSVTYTVTSYGGVSGIREPIDPRRDDNYLHLFSRGKGIPVKFKVAGDESTGFPTANWAAHKVPVACEVRNKTILAGRTPIRLNSLQGGNLFRYDVAGDQYLLNGDFRNDPAGSCWFVEVTLDDSPATVMRSATFKITK